MTPLVSERHISQMKRRFLALARGPAGTTVTIKRPQGRTGTAIDRGYSETTLATEVPAIVEIVQGVRSPGAELTRAGRHEAATHLVHVQVPGDVTWAGGVGDTDKAYRLDDKVLDESTGEEFRVVDTPAVMPDHVELTSKIE